MRIVLVNSVAGLEADAAAAPAIAAARSAKLDILLAAERHAAVAAIAGADIDFCLVKEFHGSIGKPRASMRQPLARANIAKANIFGLIEIRAGGGRETSAALPASVRG